jgi:ribosomal protein L32
MMVYMLDVLVLTLWLARAQVFDNSTGVIMMNAQRQRSSRTHKDRLVQHLQVLLVSFCKSDGEYNWAHLKSNNRTL